MALMTQPLPAPDAGAHRRAARPAAVGRSAGGRVRAPRRRAAPGGRGRRRARRRPDRQPDRRRRAAAAALRRRRSGMGAGDRQRRRVRAHERALRWTRPRRSRSRDRSAARLAAAARARRRRSCTRSAAATRRCAATSPPRPTRSRTACATPAPTPVDARPAVPRVPGGRPRDGRRRALPVRDGDTARTRRETEFAQDPVFGYARVGSARLGRRAHRRARARRSATSSLADVRLGGAARASRSCWRMHATARSSCSTRPRARTSTCWRSASPRSSGQAAASSAAAARRSSSARAGRRLPTPLDGLPGGGAAGHGLLVVGSHTELTTRQLARAVERHALRTVELDVSGRAPAAHSARSTVPPRDADRRARARRRGARRRAVRCASRRRRRATRRRSPTRSSRSSSGSLGDGAAGVPDREGRDHLPRPRTEGAGRRPRDRARPAVPRARSRLWRLEDGAARRVCHTSCSPATSAARSRSARRCSRMKGAMA